MRKLLLYVILLIVAISGYTEIKTIWQDNAGNLDETYSDLKEGVMGWYEKATDSSAEIKEKLNEQIKTATEKYEDLKEDINTISGNINEKKDQLDQTLKEIEEAKKALDELLGDSQEEENTVSGEVTAEGTSETGGAEQ